MRRIAPAVLFAALSTACSSGAFDVTTPTDDATSDAVTEDGGTDAATSQEAAVDSGGDDTGHASDGGADAADVERETALDTGSDTGSVPATDTGNDTGGAPATDTGNDTGGAPATDSGSDSGRDSDVDSCVPNGCGSCAVLPHALGSACGVCNSGKYVCNGTSDVSCSDPVTTPAPETGCGLCRTSKYVCSADGKSTFCPTPIDKNLCGGCAILAAVPGASCGTCGKYVCATNQESVTCVEATGTPVGTTCGMCSKSTYVCTEARTTACALEDDRKTVAELDASPTTTTASTTYVDGRLGQLATTTKTGRVTSVALRLSREPYACPFTATLPHPHSECSQCVAVAGGWSCTPASPIVGEITVRLIGTDGATYAHDFGLIKVVPADSSLFGATPTWVEFAFDPTKPEIPSGTRYMVGIEVNSTTYQFRWDYGAATSATQQAYSSDYSNLANPTIVDGLRPLKVNTLTCDY